MSVFDCPGCGRRLSAPEEWAGRNCSCPGCKCLVPVPARPSSVTEFVVAAAPVSATFQTSGLPGNGIPAHPDTLTGEPAPSPGANWPNVPGYEILGELGRGGMGMVYKANQHGLKRIVALKMVLAGADATESELNRFRAEGEAVARLQHPNIVQIYEVGEHQGRPFFSLEFVNGGSLDKRLAGTPLPPRDSAARAETLARAIHFAHQQGIVHRDLKPANVLVADAALADSSSRLAEFKHHLQAASQPPTEPAASSQPQSIVLKITDFGLAKQMDNDSGQTRTGAIVGTPSYMAPEQALGHGNQVGPPADVYALGALLYEMLTGRPPFKGASPMETVMQVASEDPVPPRRLQPSVPMDLETICLKCLEKEPRKRYATAELLADDLKRYLGGEPIAARPVGTLERSLKWAGRRPAVAALSALSAFIAIIGFCLVLSQWIRAEQQTRRTRDEWQRAEDANRQLKAVIVAEEQARKDAEAKKAEAELARRDAEAKKAEAEASRHDEQRRSAQLALERGIVLMEHGNAAQGFLWLGRSLGLAPGDARDLHQAAWDNLSGWHGQMHSIHCVLRGSPGGSTIAFSPDGKQVAGADKGAVRLWDLDTGRSTWSVRMPADVQAIDFRDDGRAVAIGMSNGEVVVLDLATKKVIAGPLKHPESVDAVAFHPGGNEVLTGCRDRKARRWNLPTAKEVGPALVHRDPVISVRYGPDGSLFITGCQPPRARFSDPGEFVQVWEASGQPRGDSFIHYAGVRGARFGADPRAVHWAKVDRGFLGSVGTAHKNVDVSPDGRFVVTGGYDYKVRVWDNVTGRQVGQTIYVAGWLGSVAFCPDGQHFLTFCNDVRVWDFGGLRRPRETQLELVEPVQSMRVSTDGRIVAVSHGSSSRLWDVATGQPLGPSIPHPQDGHRAGAPAMAIGPDRQTILMGSTDGKARTWNGKTGQLIHELSGHAATVLSVAFSRDGKTVMTGSEDNTARLWDAATGKPLGKPLDLGTWPWSVALTPDSKTALAGTWSNYRVHFWDVSTGRALGSGRMGGGVPCIVVDPTGKRFAASSWGDTCVRLGDVASHKLTGRTLEHPAAIHALAFSPDGARLLTGCNDGNARLYDVATGQRLGILLRVAGEVKAVAFSADGQAVLAINHSGLVRRWDLPALGGEGKALAERVGLWTELLTGLFLDQEGVQHLIGGSDLEGRRKRLDDLGGMPAQLAASAEQIHRWHQHEAADALAARRSASAWRHVRQLLKDDPENLDYLRQLGQAHALAGRGTEALQLCGRVLDRRPDDWRAWEQRAQVYARLSQWPEAATARARVAALHPHPDSAFLLAGAQLMNDDVNGYRQLCASTLTAFRGTRNTLLATQVARVCGLSAEAGVDWKDCTRLAQIGASSVNHHASQVQTLGLAAYRMGNLDQAEKALRDAEKLDGKWPGHVNTWLILALVQQQRGRTAEARQSRDKAVQWIDKAAKEQSASALTPGSLHEDDWLECQVLRREVEKMVLP